LSNSTIPSYVNKLSDANRKKWVAIFDSVYKSEGSELALIAANTWLQRNLVQKQTMNRSDKVIERVVFELDTSHDFIMRTADGDEYVSFKLADVFMDKFGVQLNDSILNKWADMINGGYPILGDVDHETSMKLAQSNLTETEIKEISKQKPSIAKAIQAVVENGRLWVKAMIDKRYKNVIQKSKGVSLEALIKRDPNSGTVLDGDLTGFAFMVNQTPAIEDTRVRFAV